MIAKKIQLTVLLIGVSLTSLRAQNAVFAAGGKATGSSGSVTYSVGQIAYKNFGNATGSVAQGVLQTTVVITDLDEALNKEISCTVYPNPTATVVNLKIENRSLKNTTAQLYDLNGKLLFQQNVNQPQTIIEVGNLIPSTYLLIVKEGNQELKTFKIIKQ